LTGGSATEATLGKGSRRNSTVELAIVALPNGAKSQTAMATMAIAAAAAARQVPAPPGRGGAEVRKNRGAFDPCDRRPAAV
jgi:hypothetical protein